MGISFMEDIMLEFVGVVYSLRGDGGWTEEFCVLYYALFNRFFGSRIGFLFDER